VNVLRASASFSQPYTSLKRCQEELAAMYRARLVARTPVPDGGVGQKSYAYTLSRRAASLAPEVADIAKSNSVFQGLSRHPYHALAIGEFGSLFEAHAAKNERVRVLERFRDRQFVAEVPEHPRLIPDGTLLVEIDGRRKLLFLELVNEASVIRPGWHLAGNRNRSRAKGRSFVAKLATYKAFNAVRRLHPAWELFERIHGPVGGFQVLVVTTRRNGAYLTTAADGANTMFVFAELDDLRAAGDVFVEPVWWLPRSAWRKCGPERTALLRA
jgi:hypothetical protein